MRQVTHSGKVVDQNGNALVGVNVFFPDRSIPKGTITDFDGLFSITGNEGERLKISHVGKRPYIVTLKKGMLQASYRLTDSVIPLDEVVVTAPRKNNGYLGVLAILGLTLFASKQLFKA